ncbi:MAG: UDP-glucose/GDP-mannose dehydrogenase family protein [Candidatus Omnitrophica bacterium]|nr:UDP-glucose/GDP-mannose dehydrogenase family protein [Candidatus Omnitrophota bacterium]MDD5488610.1 UDP-glucose/GDP-mannose dehydrogenase family protein [Candidatus Omnitrophota bacterium]
MKVSVIGTGYVGLTTGVCLADLGHTVLCVDNNAEKIAGLKKGISPIFEPGMEELLEKGMKSGRLGFVDDIAGAVKQGEIIFICVNTPSREDGKAELKYVEKVAKEVAANLDGNYRVIVDKSTVPVKTAEKVRETIERYGTEGIKFDVVSNPEFLREGTAIKDTMEPDRIVIGSDSEKATKKMLELYKPLIDRTGAPVRLVSVRSAELIKHGANTFLAMKISFANLIAQVCEEAGADALEVLDAIGLDERIGSRFLTPGIGFGGSCFPKDIAAFNRTLGILGVDSSLVRAVEQINKSAWQRFIHKVEKELWVLDGKVIGVLGLAFKPDTDDIRNAPAFKIIEELREKGSVIRVYDPKAMDRARVEYPDLEFCGDPYAVVKGAEALLVCTEWEEFKTLDLGRVKELMQVPIIFDGRNIFDKNAAEKAGFRYFGIGRA